MIEADPEKMSPNTQVSLCAAKDHAIDSNYLTLSFNSTIFFYFFLIFCWFMLRIKSDFALLQLIKRRDNIGITAQLIPWRSVTEEDYFTMPVNTPVALFSVFLGAAIWLFHAILRMYFMHVPPFVPTFVICTNFPSLLLLTIVRQRNISHVNPPPNQQQIQEQNVDYVIVKKGDITNRPQGGHHTRRD